MLLKVSPPCSLRQQCPSKACRYGCRGAPTDEDYPVSETEYVQVGRGWNTVAVSYCERQTCKRLIISLASHSIRNPESARVSVPSYLIPSPSVPDPSARSKQIWRTDLLGTEPYWEGEFRYQVVVSSEADSRRMVCWSQLAFPICEVC